MGSEMCIRDSPNPDPDPNPDQNGPETSQKRGYVAFESNDTVVFLAGGHNDDGGTTVGTSETIQEPRSEKSPRHTKLRVVKKEKRREPKRLGRVISLPCSSTAQILPVYMYFVMRSVLPYD